MKDTSRMNDTQEDWKRIQLRVPAEQYEDIINYAKDNHISINSAVLDLASVGLDVVERGKPISDIKIIRLPNGIKRRVFGKMVGKFDIDYTNENLSELKRDIESCLEIMSQSSRIADKFKFYNKRVAVHEGGHHIDIYDDGVGTLNWLTIEDHDWSLKSVTYPLYACFANYFHFIGTIICEISLLKPLL